MFKRRIEDFICENCGTPVKGNGYTNHCPECLWSKHVDIDPGDRASQCGGLMEPKGCNYSVSDRWILHRCTVCGTEKKNRLSEEDSMRSLLNI